MNQKSIFSIILASIVVCVWGITFVSTKYLLNYFSAFEILFTRYFLAFCALWIIYPHKLTLKNKKDEILFILAGLTGIVIYQLMENMAIGYTNASNVSIIVSICPMFTAILTQLILKEKAITPKFVIGFIIAITGVMLVCFNGVFEVHLNPLGDILALVSGISWGFYSILVSKINKMELNPIATTRRIFFWASIIMIPLIFTGAFIPGLSSTNFHVNIEAAANLARFTNPLCITNLLFLGLVASSFCFIAWNTVCHNLGTVKVSVALYLIPVVTVIFAFFFLGETLTPLGFAGAICTLLGVFISNK